MIQRRQPLRAPEGQGGFASASPAISRQTRWEQMQRSPVAWERVVGLAMDHKTLSRRQGPGSLLTISNTAIYAEIKDADNLMPAINEFVKEGNTLGLVLIAGIREGTEREAALRALAQISDGYSLHTAQWKVEITDGFVCHAGRKIAWNDIYNMAELIARIALEADSVGFATLILHNYLIAHGSESAKPLVDLLVKHDEWRAIDNAIRCMSNELVCSLAPHIPAIARAGKGIEKPPVVGFRSILQKIAAVHPERGVRLHAIAAIKHGGTCMYWGAQAALVEAARDSLYEDTGRLAIDEAVKLAKPNKDGEIMDAGLGELLLKHHRVLPVIRAYALQRLFEVWDRTTGYGYPHQWDLAPQDVKSGLLGYFERNFDRLVTNLEHRALLMVVEQRSSKAQEALIALSRNYDELPKGNWPLLSALAQFSPDETIRRRADNQLVENRRAADQARL